VDVDSLPTFFKTAFMLNRGKSVSHQVWKDLKGGV